MNYPLSGEMRQKQQTRLRNEAREEEGAAGLMEFWMPREEAPADLELFSQEECLPGFNQEKGN